MTGRDPDAGAADATEAALEAVYLERGDRFHPNAHAAGPWTPNAQHGAALNGLLALGLERALGESALAPARLTFDLFRPAPMAPLALETRELYRSRRLALVEATLAAPDGPCACASGLFLPAPEVAPDAERLAGPEELEEGSMLPPQFRERALPGYAAAVRLRWTRGIARRHALWLRCARPLVSGHTQTALQRAAAAADFTTAVAVLTALREGRPPAALINADTSLHLTRAPEGEWIGFELAFALDAGARGQSCARVFDRRGALGQSLQASVAARRGVPGAPAPA